jgi:hypothetical protein
MPIDDPISAIQSLNASDERQRSPVSRFAKPFLEIGKLFAPPGTKIPLAGIGAAVHWLDRRAEMNREEVWNATAEEMKYRGAQIDRLLADSEEHQHFMAEEMPALVLDALRRAEQTRAKERIRRLGRILVHAAEVGPRDGADYAEEMMRAATEVTDREMTVLHEIDRAFAGSVVDSGPGATPHSAAIMGWRSVAGRISMTPGEILGCCLKLESYGLIRRAEDRAKNNLSDEPLAFGLLLKGRHFIEYVRTATPTMT